MLRDETRPPRHCKEHSDAAISICVHGDFETVFVVAPLNITGADVY
jgi:hypothetical protein